MIINSFKDFLASNNFPIVDGIWYSNSEASLSYPEEGYDDCFELEEHSFWFKHRNDCLVSLVKRHSENSCFFDIGGGNGFVTKALQNYQIVSVLVEPGKSGVLNAKKRGVENVYCGTLADLNGLKGEISAIGTFDVIEHIEDDHQFIKEIFSMLSKDGTFYLTVPAFQSLWSNEDTDAGHYRRYTKQSISKLLTNNGFKIVYATYFFSFLVFPLFLIRTIPSKLGIRKKS